MKATGRLIDEPNMDRWAGVKFYFQPAQMSGEELAGKIHKLQQAFYSWPSILRRLRFPRTQADLASWNVNLTQRKVALHSDFMNEFSEF